MEPPRRGALLPIEAAAIPDAQQGQVVEISTADMRDHRAARIVVYDDDRLPLEVLVAVVKREGYQVTATNLEQEEIA